MKNILIGLIGLVVLGATSCTKQDWIDTGTPLRYHDCSMMTYLRGDTYNWELTVALIERAGLVNLFEGNDPGYREITFFAPPSYAVLRYVWDKASRKMDYPNDNTMWRTLTEEEREHPERLVQELDIQWCREMVLRHVVKGKIMKSDIGYRDIEYPIYDALQAGGTDIITEGGSRLRAYRDKSDYQSVLGAGAETMYIYSFTRLTQVPLASPDIQTNNGVVHALNYNYLLGEI